MLEKMKEVMVDQLGVEADDIKESTSFKDDLGVDSLDIYQLVMALEEEYSIELPSEEMAEIATVGEMMQYLKDKGVTA